MDGTYDDALKRWFALGKTELAPESDPKKMDGAKFLQRNCRLVFTTRTNGRKKIQRVPR